MEAARPPPSGGSPSADSPDTAAATADSSGASGGAEPEWGPPPPPPLGRRHSNKRFTGLKLFGRSSISSLQGWSNPGSSTCYGFEESHVSQLAGPGSQAN
ncbi:hypothetical protein DUI87_22946 [Hirundo rustica rustica]|uniref:Uncharacterized protein n=1 Tax=Hirundo rustica rustica TaxID=333673 RepID=A0A3M0JGS4_HIRRU|nr:hypothetical protein DUI87_22946 [Hirundo rustica rustica]